MLSCFSFLQLKSSLMLHTDGTSPVAEDIGRQVHFHTRSVFDRFPHADHVARLVAQEINIYCHLFLILVTFSAFLQLLTYGRRIPYAELFARIDAVDPTTIKRVANRFFYDRVGTATETWLKLMNFNGMTH